MSILDVKVNANLVILSNNIPDDRVRFRLLDMGLYRGAKVVMLDNKKHKHNILISFNSVKYMLDKSLARDIEVDYA